MRIGELDEPIPAGRGTAPPPPLFESGSEALGALRGEDSPDLPYEDLDEAKLLAELRDEGDVDLPDDDSFPEDLPRLTGPLGPPQTIQLESIESAEALGDFGSTDSGDIVLIPEPAEIEIRGEPPTIRISGSGAATAAPATAAGAGHARNPDLSPSSAFIDATTKLKMQLYCIAVVKKQCLEIATDKSLPDWERKYARSVAADMDVLRDYARGDEVPVSLIEVKVAQLGQLLGWLEKHAGRAYLAYSIARALAQLGLS